jgi:hypothetical protein
MGGAARPTDMPRPTDTPRAHPLHRTTHEGARAFSPISPAVLPARPCGLGQVVADMLSFVDVEMQHGTLSARPALALRRADSNADVCRTHTDSLGTAINALLPGRQRLCAPDPQLIRWM